LAQRATKPENAYRAFGRLPCPPASIHPLAGQP
jgi:hypothetical protein